MYFALQDPGAWSEVASFDLSDQGATPPKHPQRPYHPSGRSHEGMGYHMDTPAVSDMGKHCASQGKQVPQGSPSLGRFGTPTLCVRKRRKEQGDQSPTGERICGPMNNHGSNSPRGTPVKALPFSPSQVSLISNHVEMLYIDIMEPCGRMCSKHISLFCV